MKYNLSEITAVIKDRRTIYPEFFSERKVHQEIIENVLNNAIWAPTHGLTQPWRFKVFTNGSRIRLSNKLVEIYNKHTLPENYNEIKALKMQNRPLKSQVVIAVCMVKDTKGKIPEIEEVEAVACAVQNIHLTCTAYGLGGFWSTPGVIYKSEMNQFLKLAENDKCLGLFYIGYPAGDWPSPGHRKPIEYVTEWIK
ncbi:MAG: nitroreductase [Flavobacteriales bacterium]